MYRFSEHPLSWAAITRVIIAALTVFLVWRSFSVLIIILVSVMLATALHPIVLKMSKKIPITISATIVVFALLLPIVLILASVLPGFIGQFPDIVKTVNNIINNSTFLPDSIRNNIDLTQYAQNGGKYLLASTSKITNFVTTFITILTLTIYLLIDAKQLQHVFLKLIPDDKEKEVSGMLDELARINGQYIRGNLLISLVCGIVIFLGLMIIGVPYAAPLAIFAAILDLLPLIGAFIGAAPAVIIAFAINPTAGILVLALFLVYQQVENSILSPNIYNKALDLSPALSFIAVMIGTTLFGIVGAFLSLPLAASVPTLFKYIRKFKSGESPEKQE